jgi:hypothetical protein
MEKRQNSRTAKYGSGSTTWTTLLSHVSVRRGCVKKQVRRVRSEKFCPSFCATLLLVQKDQLKAKAPWHENVIQAMGKEGDI